MKESIREIVRRTCGRDTVALNVDDTGYLKNTAWPDNNDGFLFLDRNLNGQISALDLVWDEQVAANDAVFEERSAA